MEAARRDKARQRQANGPLVAAALSAVAGGLLARELGLVAAAAAFAAAALLTVWHRRPGPWLLLAPAALAAAAPTASHHPAVPPHPAVHRSSSGTVRFAGEVLTGVRWDPVLCQESFRLAHQHQVWLCVVQGRTRALPGDLVRGIGRATSPPDDGANRSGARPHRLPRVLTTHDAVTVVRGRPSPARFAEACRLRMQDALLQAIPGEHGVLLAHLVLGRGPALPDDLVAAHRATGLSHLLAVSGAHATMLAWMLGLLFWLATSRSPLTSVGYRRIAAAILLLYGGITGMEPPVFRALVATFVFFLCAATNRRLSVGTVLALPALFTAVLMPRDLFGVSFNLSYAAVFGLALSGVLHKGTLQRRLLMAPLVGSMWATLTTMPLTLWYFGQFAPWTILATPLLSPLIAMMLGLGLVAGGLGAVAPGLADGVVLALALPLQGMTFLYCESVRLIACLPLAPVFAGPRPDLMVLGALGLLGVAFLLFRRDRIGVVGLCLLLSLPHFLPTTERRPPGLELLAVGHGQACLLRLPDGRRALVDCGSLGNPTWASRAVQDALLPDRRIDLLVVTHGDFDHVGAVPHLVARLPVRRAVLPAELRTSELALLLSQQGASLAFLARGEQRHLTPHLQAVRPNVDSDDRNDHSMWVRVDLGSFQVLLSGDPLETGVRAYLAGTRPEPCDVLVLPHHGREHGASEELLRAVQPKLALVSCPRQDGISAQAIVARKLGIPTLHTGLRGSLQVDATDPPVVHTQRPLLIRTEPGSDTK